MLFFIEYLQNISALLKKPLSTDGYFDYIDELSNQLNTAVISYASVCVLRAGAFSFPQKFFHKIFKLIGIVLSSGTGGLRKGKLSPTFANAKGGETMNEPIRTQWQIRCAFNGYCKRALQNEMLATKGDIKRRRGREVTFF